VFHARETAESPASPPFCSASTIIHPARDPFARTLARWLVLSEASNSINRCMGLPDLYPFVISGVTADKLGFVHDVIGNARSEQSRTAA
jgi:hypothetical protein